MAPRSAPLLLLLLTPAAADPPLLPFEAVEPHMGTLIHITLYCANGQSATDAFRAAFDRIHALDEILSDYKPRSELNTICRTAVRRSVVVSEELFRVLSASQQMAEESGGAFDITLGPVIRLWRDARAHQELPDAAALREAGARCGYGKLHLNRRDRSVMLDQAGMQLDVGGIAKGYAADEALAVLTGLGIHSALVAASGDLAFSDAPPGRRGWKIGVASSDPAHPDVGLVLELSNAAVSTSGDTEQHLEIAGRRYSHIIDPSNFLGLTSGVSATVVAPRAIDSDAWSTTLCVLGADRGLKLVEQHAGIAARMAIPARGRMQGVESPSFRELTRLP